MQREKLFYLRVIIHNTAFLLIPWWSRKRGEGTIEEDQRLKKNLLSKYKGNLLFKFFVGSLWKLQGNLSEKRSIKSLKANLWWYQKGRNT